MVRNQIATAQEWIQRSVPGYRLRTLALPMGAYPREVGWAVSGSANGATYRNDAILMVAGGAAPSPYAKSFDAQHLPRIQSVEHEIAGWLAYFEHHRDERYVSDGDPATITVPAGSAGKVRVLPGTRIADQR